MSLFFLGPRFLEFGQYVQGRTILIEASRPIMDWLVVETKESIFLGVVSGTDALCVAARESPRSVRLFAQVGRRAPLHSGGVPKTLLAFLPEAKRNAALEHFYQKQFDGMDDISNRDALENRLGQIRRQGYLIVVDELDKGAHSVAAPIYDHLGQIAAALSIAGPSHRFVREAIDRYVQLILDATAQISYVLGSKTHQPRAIGEINAGPF